MDRPGRGRRRQPRQRPHHRSLRHQERGGQQACHGQRLQHHRGGRGELRPVPTRRPDRDDNPAERRPCDHQRGEDLRWRDDPAIREFGLHPVGRPGRRPRDGRLGDGRRLRYKGRRLGAQRHHRRRHAGRRRRGQLCSAHRPGDAQHYRDDQSKDPERGCHGQSHQDLRWDEHRPTDQLGLHGQRLGRRRRGDHQQDRRDLQFGECGFPLHWPDRDGLTGRIRLHADRLDPALQLCPANHRLGRRDDQPRHPDGHWRHFVGQDLRRPDDRSRERRRSLACRRGCGRRGPGQPFDRVCDRGLRQPERRDLDRYLRRFRPLGRPGLELHPPPARLGHPDHRNQAGVGGVRDEDLQPQRRRDRRLGSGLYPFRRARRRRGQCFGQHGRRHGNLHRGMECRDRA